MSLPSAEWITGFYISYIESSVAAGFEGLLRNQGVMIIMSAKAGDAL